ncbi:MAG: discoidin domain-containing protein [Lentisphaerae bacterium]|mgnify:CR=1 FL=1|jgi:hypothetical protein|nr:discoidin domain-containing protein [Lentisphaerota bacterium]MBT4819987.1 discoidin domain-containing protein [Lentisphaerota bacterium]MBT5604864.1 discoidin domain-containing protein [Lentisphaerota bacterium]MBT7054217.1 discoidin domain-containing protein [Lentisphaerota bacterium]MBT7841014.1 discoidin domain-containing protein [Lentisphaerota bacterium]
MTFVRTLACSVLIAGAAAAAGSASPCLMYDIQTTTSVTIRCKPLENARKVLFLNSEGTWTEASMKATDGGKAIRVDVTRIKAGKTILLVDPPEWMNCADRTPPVVRSISIDGKKLPAGGTIDLGTVGTVPGTITMSFEDEHNPIAPGSLQATMDGSPLPAEGFALDNAKEKLSCRLRPGDTDYGPHVINLSVADRAPFANTASLRIRFNYLDTNDIAQASLGAKVTVDSCYSGYEPETLIDGDSQSCAGSGSPTTTWASAETGAEHWVEIAFPKPQQVDGIALYWAYRKPAKRVLAQIHKNGEWTTLGTAERKQGEQVSSTIRFAPVTIGRIRVLQPPNCGREDRPNLFWLGEISVRKSE